MISDAEIHSRLQQQLREKVSVKFYFLHQKHMCTPKILIPY